MALDRNCPPPPSSYRRPMTGHIPSTWRGTIRCHFSGLPEGVRPSTPPAFEHQTAILWYYRGLPKLDYVTPHQQEASCHCKRFTIILDASVFRCTPRVSDRPSSLPPLHQWYQHQHSVQDALVCWWQCYLPADLVWGGSRNSSTRPKHPGRLVHKMAHGIQHQEVCYPDHHKEAQPEHVPVYPTEWGYP